MQLEYHFNADQYFYVSESWHTHGRLIYYPHLAGIQHIFKQWHMLVGASSNTDLIKLDNRLQSEIASYVSEYSCIVREGWHIDVNGETPRQVGQHWNRSNQHLRHTGHVISCHLFNQLILVHQYELILVQEYEANIETRATVPRHWHLGDRSAAAHIDPPHLGWRRTWEMWRLTRADRFSLSSKSMIADSPCVRNCTSLKLDWNSVIEYQNPWALGVRGVTNMRLVVWVRWPHAEYSEWAFCGETGFIEV